MQAAITEDLRGALREAIVGWEVETITPSHNVEALKALNIALTRYIALTGTNMGVDAREEWISVAMEELIEFPISLLLDTVKAARRTVPFPNQFVPAICDKIAARAAALTAEGNRLRKLAELA